MKMSRFFAGFLLLTVPVFAQTQTQSDLKTTVELSQGYLRDNLKITVSRPGNPEKGKDQFKDVNVYTTRLGFKIEKCDIFLKGYAGYGNVCDGKFQSTEHFSGRTWFGGRFEDHIKKKSHLTGNYTADFVLNLGKNFHLPHGWSVAPQIGYGVYIEKFKTSQGREHTIGKDEFGKHHHSRRGTREDIDATWYSPQIGLQAKKTFTETLSAMACYQFLFPLNYDAKGHHNIKNPRKTKYDQENKAYKSFGNIASLGLEWKFLKGWSLKPEIELMKFYAKGGDSNHHFRLRKATRSAFEARLVLGYSF